MLFLVGLTGFSGFLVAFRLVNVLVLDWLIKEYETFSLVNSWCLRNKLKLTCDLKSLSGNVILQVLFPAAVIVLVPVQWFLARKKDNVLLTHPSCSSTINSSFYFPFISILPPPHGPYIELPTSTFSPAPHYYFLHRQVI